MDNTEFVRGKQEMDDRVRRSIWCPNGDRTTEL